MSSVATARRPRTGLGLLLVAIVVGAGMYLAAGYGKSTTFLGLGQVKAPNIHGRMYNNRLPSIVFLDVGLNMLRVGDYVVGSLSCFVIPAPERAN